MSRKQVNIQSRTQAWKTCITQIERTAHTTGYKYLHKSGWNKHVKNQILFNSSMRKSGTTLNRLYLDKFEAPEALDRCIQILSVRSRLVAWFWYISANRLSLTVCTENHWNWWSAPKILEIDSLHPKSSKLTVCIQNRRNWRSASKILQIDDPHPKSSKLTVCTQNHWNWRSASKTLIIK